MSDVGRRAAPRVLRLVAAGGPDAFDGEIRFHPRLTVLADARPGLASWVGSLLGAKAPADTLLEIDGIPARTYDLPRALRALPAAEPLRADMLADLASGRSRNGAGGRAAATPQTAHELARWEAVLHEARARLVRAHESAPHLDPVDLAEAARLRSEWLYAEQVDSWEPTRSTRREASLLRDQYDELLARFGAASFEDLSMVGTGFGDTEHDVAIREAATVVSMAEQRCHKLRMAHERARRAESDGDEAAIAAAADDDAPEVDLASLDAERADRLLARALADLDNTAYVRPLVIDRVLDAFGPSSRRRAYDRLVTHARRRQIVLVTATDDVARWATTGAPADVALRLDHAPLSHAD